jgi:Zn-finger nucleic acid-binding protein
MKCPSCKSDMIILELNKVEIDYCTNCKGIWLDAGELELLYHNTNSKIVNELFSKSENNPELKIKCPVCGKKMDKVDFKQTGIILDSCKNNHGLWFDKGELRLLLESDIDSNSEIIELFKNIFSH